MHVIRIETLIDAQIEIVFDLSRSIDLHRIAASHTREEAISGTTRGLIGMGEQVTWRARHLGFAQTLTSKITAFDPPHYFVDEMIDGIFRKMKHEHFFRKKENRVNMVDLFWYELPFGMWGKMANGLLLKNYLARFLQKRNRAIKLYAESGKWKKLLGQA